MSDPILALKIGQLQCMCFYGPGAAGSHTSEHELELGDRRSDQAGKRASSRRSRPRSARRAGSAHHLRADRREPAGASSYQEEQEALLSKKAPLNLRGAVAEARKALGKHAEVSEDSSAAESSTREPQGVSSAAEPEAEGESPSFLSAAEKEGKADVDLPPDTRADFSGSWMLARTEGDFDAFLKDIGVGYAMRCLASSLSYGVGKMTNDIVHCGDKFHIVSWSPKGTFTSDLRLDGTEQAAVDPLEGRPMLTTPRWEAGGASISMESRRADTGEICPLSRRFLQGDEMVVEQTSKSGLVVRRFFARQ